MFCTRVYSVGVFWNIALVELMAKSMLEKWGNSRDLYFVKMSQHPYLIRNNVEYHVHRRCCLDNLAIFLVASPTLNSVICIEVEQRAAEGPRLGQLSEYI